MEATSRPIQILLADDDADDRSFFKEALTEVPVSSKLITMEDGQKLMDFISTIDNPPPPDLIFLDINMPCKTGKVWKEYLPKLAKEKFVLGIRT